MADRVHPMTTPDPAMPEAAESPRSTTSSNTGSLPARKPAPEPGTYVIQVPKDVVLRQPLPGNAHLSKVYARRATRRRNRCCLCITWLFALLFLLAVAAGVLYLVFRPRAPNYTITGLSISSFNLTAATVSPFFNVTVRADNHRNKKMGIYYRDGSDITAVYDGVTLCKGKWPAFYQPPRNETMFVTELRGAGISLGADVEQTLAAAQREGKVPLEVNLKVPVRVKFGAMKSWTIKVKVKCEVTVDGLRENAVILNRDCHVRVKLLGFLGL
ncbi:NDR1/HIN1-like protein 13 [Curcuma longa]|uniref:NDR1/HIN1-like protein 13 n=1 Tax=Curcuma longa TaxID=136217 RepID=UPI003D9F243C